MLTLNLHSGLKGRWRVSSSQLTPEGKGRSSRGPADLQSRAGSPGYHEGSRVTCFASSKGFQDYQTLNGCFKDWEQWWGKLAVRCYRTSPGIRYGGKKRSPSTRGSAGQGIGQAVLLHCGRVTTKPITMYNYSAPIKHVERKEKAPSSRDPLHSSSPSIQNNEGGARPKWAVALWAQWPLPTLTAPSHIGRFSLKF